MVGNSIKHVRESKQIKRQWLAEMLDIDETTLGKIENNQIGISVQRLVEISKLLEVNINEFFEEQVLALRTDPAANLSAQLHKSAYIEFIYGQKEMVERTNKLLIDQNLLLVRAIQQANGINEKLMQFLNLKP